ncbi:MAG TPA: tryptophan 7-halogenase [Steroidobacteraceae bacterium]
MQRIIVCGNGLAAHLTAVALARQLPPTIRITWVNGADSRDADLFFGGITAPSAYAFNLAAGVSEPRMMLDTDSTFSWGTHFQDWGAANISWVQCSHLPLPIIGGVLFHHHLWRLGIGELEPFLTPAIAARRGVFAHPVDKGPKLLSRAEYGYQFNPYSYRLPFAAAATAFQVEVVTADILEVVCGEGTIFALRLSDGREIEADLFVDCTGPDARLLSRLGVEAPAGRRLRAAYSQRPTERVGPPCRSVVARDFGWQSETSLKGSVARLTVYAPETESEALSAHGEPQHTGEITLGRRASTWVGNCVAIGHAASVLEPLSHAPMLLLEREIDRLLTLVPFSDEMSVERREYNRQGAEDYAHAHIFNRALYETPPKAQTSFWLAAQAEPPDEKLIHKLTQFESRGLLAAFDLEPFTAEDWVVLHHGMRRRPVRHDRMADRTPVEEVRPMLDSMSREIEKLVKTMPTHHDYMLNLVRYLRQNKS